MFFLFGKLFCYMYAKKKKEIYKSFKYIFYKLFCLRVTRVCVKTYHFMPFNCLQYFVFNRARPKLLDRPDSSVSLAVTLTTHERTRARDKTGDTHVHRLLSPGIHATRAEKTCCFRPGKQVP